MISFACSIVVVVAGGAPLGMTRHWADFSTSRLAQRVHTYTYTHILTDTNEYVRREIDGKQHLKKEHASITATTVRRPAATNEKSGQYKREHTKE